MFTSYLHRCVFSLLLFASLAALGCAKELDTTSRSLGSIERDCVVPLPAGLQSWGAPIALEYPDRSLWIWPSVTLEGGRTVRNVAALVTGADAACSGTLALFADTSGVVSLLQLDDAELAANAGRSDGRRVELTPTGGFVHQNRGYLYYEKRLVGPGIFDSELIGSGLCTIEQPGDPCVRVRPKVHDGEPTLLFLGPRSWNRGAFVDEGYANLVGCFHAAAFEDLCSLARVRPEQAGDPNAYEFRGFDDWTRDQWNTLAVLQSAGAVTPSYNAHLGRYLWVAADIWSSKLRLHAGHAPWGGFDLEGTLFDALAPSQQWFIAGGVEHTGLRRDDGRTIAISYYTDSERAPGLHLVSYRLSDRLR